MSDHCVVSKIHQDQWLEFLSRTSLPEDLHQQIATTFAQNWVTVGMVKEASKAKKLKEDADEFLSAAIQLVTTASGPLSEVQRLVVKSAIINRCVIEMAEEQVAKEQAKQEKAFLKTLSQSKKDKLEGIDSAIDWALGLESGAKKNDTIDHFVEFLKEKRGVLVVDAVTEFKARDLPSNDEFLIKGAIATQVRARKSCRSLKKFQARYLKCREQNEKMCCIKEE